MKKNEATPPIIILSRYTAILPAVVLKDGRIISVVAVTKPRTQWDAIEWNFSKTFFITLDSSKRVTSIAAPKGSITPRSSVDMPSDIFSYMPKKSRSVEELKPGTIKLSPQRSPQTSHPAKPG